MKHKGSLKISNLCVDNPNAKIDVCDEAEVFIDGNKI